MTREIAPRGVIREFKSRRPHQYYSTTELRIPSRIWGRTIAMAAAKRVIGSRIPYVDANWINRDWITGVSWDVYRARTLEAEKGRGTSAENAQGQGQTRGLTASPHETDPKGDCQKILGRKRNRSFGDCTTTISIRDCCLGGEPCKTDRAGTFERSHLGRGALFVPSTCWAAVQHEHQDTNCRGRRTQEY